MDNEMKTDEQIEHEQELAKIEARKEFAKNAPTCFAVWSITSKVVHCLFWLTVIALLAQCSCECILPNGVHDGQ